MGQVGTCLPPKQISNLLHSLFPFPPDSQGSAQLIHNRLTSALASFIGHSQFAPGAPSRPPFSPRLTSLPPGPCPAPQLRSSPHFQGKCSSTRPACSKVIHNRSQRRCITFLSIRIPKNVPPLPRAFGPAVRVRRSLFSPEIPLDAARILCSYSSLPTIDGFSFQLLNSST